LSEEIDIGVHMFVSDDHASFNEKSTQWTNYDIEDRAIHFVRALTLVGNVRLFVESESGWFTAIPGALPVSESNYSFFRRRNLD
jgi:hypothetical protein